MIDTFTEKSSEYEKLLQTNEWREKRQSILIRDGYKCYRCGSGSGLEVHHRQYHKKLATGHFVKPWKYKNNNLITLCRNCHQQGHHKFTVPVFYV